MYFEIKFSNGYCGCDEEIYVQANSEEVVEKYADEYLTDGYEWYEDWGRCIDSEEDYDSEEEYWDAVDEYQQGCSYEIRQIDEEEVVYDELIKIED